MVEPLENNQPALERATALAEHHQASLLIVDVVDHLPIEFQTLIEDERQQLLDAMVAPYRQRVALKTRVLRGTPFLETIREVLRNEHDLLIKPYKSSSWLGRLFDSNDMNLLRECPCPVWMVRPDIMGAFDNILASVDINDGYIEDQVNTQQQLNKHILDLASSIALAEFAELHIVSVWNAPGESLIATSMSSTSTDRIAEYVDDTRQHCEINFDTLIRQSINSLGDKVVKYLKLHKYLLKGEPLKEIPALAERAEVDLVVMGTVARTGIAGLFMGNTAETILNRLDCSVIALKPPGFVSPVSLDD